MKKLLMATIVLFLFTLSVITVQTSCSKSEAQQRPLTPTDTTQIGKILFLKSETGVIDPEVWLTNYDGTNATQVSINLPADVHIANDLTAAAVRLSPNGQTIFFSGYVSGESVNKIYACDVDGSNVRIVVPSTTNKILKMQGAY